MPSSQQGDFTKYLETILRDGIADGLMVLVSKEGDRRFVHYRNSLRTTSADRPFIRGLARDVTERENALNALRRSERHFRSIIEHVSDMIVIVGQDGATTFHGPATERLLGRPGAAIDGANFRDLVHPDDGERFDGLLHPADAKQNDVRSADLRLLHGDGSWRWFSIVASSIGTPGGPTTVIMNGRDITDRRLLEAQLEQAGRLTSLGRLTATVAHEFNNVLMGMQPFADLMQRPNVPPEVVLKGAKHIANSIARGKRVALDMLRFTRPPQPAVAAVELREWWGKIAPELVAATGDLIRITSSFDEALTVTADAAQIAQVFSNLICNARDAMPRGGSIDIRGRRPARGEGFSFGLVESPERFAHIAVRDTGCGMPEDVLRHAFDPLFTTKQSGGTGLGLAVAHQVVAKHGGHIFAESEVGKGTTFHLFLPLTAETPKSEISASETDPKVQARRILIIDDEPLIGDGIAQTVAEWGMTSEVVRNGLDAVGAAKRMKPEVAVIDIWLPDVDGLTVGEELRKLDPNMKLIFASGHGDATQAVRDCYPAAFLQKPFDTRQLLETIATLERESRR
jgi:PAS domain S-box-containing protein